MVYMFDSELPENKSIFNSLMYIYGVGESHSDTLCKSLGFSRNLKFKSLSKKQIDDLGLVIKHSKICLGNELRKQQQLAKNSLVTIKSYRGLRRYKGLPVRGQRTHTNAKTARKRK